MKPVRFGRGPVLPRTFGFLQVDGAVVVSAVRAGEGGAAVVRLYNPGAEAVACAVALPDGIGEAWSCDLEEQPLEALSVANGQLKLSVPTRRIMTLLLR